MPGELEIIVESIAQGRVLVRVRGELDMASVSGLESALERGAAAEDIAVDLTECTFLDSSALRVILAGAARAESTGGSLSLVAPEHGVRRTLEIAGVDTRLTIHPALEKLGD